MECPRVRSRVPGRTRMGWYVRRRVGPDPAAVGAAVRRYSPTVPADLLHLLPWQRETAGATRPQCLRQFDIGGGRLPALVPRAGKTGRKADAASERRQAAPVRAA